MKDIYMKNKIISGKELSAKLRFELGTKIFSNKCIMDEYPKLAVILVGKDPASEIYVRNKSKACEEVGILHNTYQMSEKVSEQTLLELIYTLNKDSSVSGILVQLPLPKHIDEKLIINAISPDKDVDCFTKENIGKMFLGDETISPCTPKGIISLIESVSTIEGKHCVVLGRSNIVGKPISTMLINRGATVTCCNSKTKNLKDVCRAADILISAIGKPEYINADYIKDGCIIIDVGINHNAEGKLCGDVDFNSVIDKCSFITPVPGGVGPMTITMLLENTFTLYKRSRFLEV